MFGSIAAGFVKTPMFVVNSKYDTWQEEAIIGANVRSRQFPLRRPAILLIRPSCVVACMRVRAENVEREKREHRRENPCVLDRLRPQDGGDA